jgi:hypothetical protein
MSKKQRSRAQAGTAITARAATISPPDPVRAKMSSVIVMGMNNLETRNGIANAYKSLAANIYQSAKTMLANCVGQHILLYHAIELALKGYLLQHDASLDEEKLQKKFSHDLEKLYEAAKAKGLKVKVKNEGDLIKWANEHHNFGLLRYDIANFKTLPICTDIYPVVDAILVAIVPETIQVSR